MRRIKDLVIEEISILFDGPPAVQSAKVLIAKTQNDDDRWSPEYTRKILALVDSIEAKLELAKREFEMRKVGLEGLLTDPARADDFLKSDFVDEATLSRMLDRYCAAFEAAMRQDLGLRAAPTAGPVVPTREYDPEGFDAQEGRREFAARRRAQENGDEKRVVDDDNADLYRRHVRNRTRPE